MEIKQLRLLNFKCPMSCLIKGKGQREGGGEAIESFIINN